MSRFEKEKISIKDIAPAVLYRLVPTSRTPKASREIELNLELDKSITNKLSFEVQWNGKIYGFLIKSIKLVEFLQSIGLTEDSTMFISSWADKLVLTIEDSTVRREASYYVDEEEVINLLEGALKPRSIKRIK